MSNQRDITNTNVVELLLIYDGERKHYCLINNFNRLIALRTEKHLLCILEVDLEYPEKLHDIHNDYPMVPESITLEPSDVAKLIPNLNDKKKYVLHYENLKLYESLGLNIVKIHRGIKFEESAWLK